MIEIRSLSLPGGPQLELLHAADGTDVDALRERARARSAGLGPERRVSRSYAHPYALIAHHDAAVGVDIERIGPCDVVFAASICTPAELESLRVLDWASVTSLWSSKEALAKALGDARLHDRRRLEGPAGWKRGVSGPWRAEAIEVTRDYRAWVCWRAPVVEPRSESRSATRARVRSRTAIAGA